MPRPSRSTSVLTLRIPTQLYLELRVLLVSADGAPRYGTWGATFERILREWVDAQKASRQ